MEWKQVVIDGEEWGYEVSDCGDVRNMKTGRVLKQEQTDNGYLRTVLSKNGKVKAFLTHRLVAIMFIPNHNNLETVNHINENKLDNRVDNLEWMTRRNNISYGTRAERQAKTVSKTMRKQKGKKVMAISITENKVLVFQSLSQAIELGFDKARISDCCRGKRKSHKGYTWKFL